MECKTLSVQNPDWSKENFGACRYCFKTALKKMFLIQFTVGLKASKGLLYTT